MTCSRICSLRDEKQRGSEVISAVHVKFPAPSDSRSKHFAVDHSASSSSRVTPISLRVWNQVCVESSQTMRKLRTSQSPDSWSHRIAVAPHSDLPFLPYASVCVSRLRPGSTLAL